MIDADLVVMQRMKITHSAFQVTANDLQPLAVPEVMYAQENIFSCIQAALIVRLPDFLFIFHTEAILVLISSIEGTSQQYARTTMLLIVLHRCHYFLLGEQPGEQRAYDVTTQHFYMPYKVNDEYVTVATCLSCRLILRTRNNREKLYPFPPANPPDTVIVYILGPVPETGGESTYIVIITNHCSELAKAILNAKKTATRISNISTHYCMSNFGVSNTVLTDYGPQLTSEFFPKHF